MIGFVSALLARLLFRIISSPGLKPRRGTGLKGLRLAPGRGFGLPGPSQPLPGLPSGSRAGRRQGSSTGGLGFGALPPARSRLSRQLSSIPLSTCPKKKYNNNFHPGKKLFAGGGEAAEAGGERGGRGSSRGRWILGCWQELGNGIGQMSPFPPSPPGPLGAASERVEEGGKLPQKKPPRPAGGPGLCGRMRGENRGARLRRLEGLGSKTAALPLFGFYFRFLNILP